MHLKVKELLISGPEADHRNPLTILPAYWQRLVKIKIRHGRTLCLKEKKRLCSLNASRY